MIDRRERFALGVCYYPEHWPRERWAGYARQMRELGLTYVRIAEFAWSRIEPAREAWNWEWLDEAIETIAAEGLRLILCTPTATPPDWLVAEHPEILPVGRDGVVRQFGSRRHYDIASPVYRAESRRITRAIAGRYGTHPALVGWQTDNEFGDHDTGRTWTVAARDGFRAWLRARYGTLEALNAAWGAVFWSQEYTAWERIELPATTVAEPNPSHVLDFRRYCSDQYRDFDAEQIAILRELSPGRWVTHNFMRLCDEFDHYPVARDLDFVSWDVYPTGAVEYSRYPEEVKARFARVGVPDLLGFNHDLYRCMSRDGGHWVMEHQVGQINWAPHNALPAPGAVALWTTLAWAHGADVVSYFRWKAATVAQELMHSGVLRHDDTLDRGGEEIAALEMPGRVNVPVRNAVALLHDYESLWMQAEQPHTAGAVYWDQVMLFYTALRSLGVDVDVRHPDEDLTGYRLIVAPALQLVGAERAQGIAAAVAAGARFVAGPRTGYRTPSGRVHEEGQPGPLRDLLGVALRNFDGLPPWLSVRAGGHEVGIWAEAYRLCGAEAVVRYADGPLAGEAAVTRHGRATAIGAWSASLVTAVLRDELVAAGLEPLADPLPLGVRRSRRGETTVWMNFDPEPVEIAGVGTLAPVSSVVRGSSAEPHVR